jgi:hypothetical protein
MLNFSQLFRLVGLVATLCIFLQSQAIGAEASRFSDPSVVAKQIIELAQSGQNEKLAFLINDAVGQSTASKDLENGLAIIKGKKADFSELVYEKKFGTSLWQMIYRAGPVHLNRFPGLIGEVSAMC